MPVLSKAKHRKLRQELHARVTELLDAFESRELKDSREGVKGRGCWGTPENVCATVGDGLRLGLAVEDFKVILSEIKKLK